MDVTREVRLQLTVEDVRELSEWLELAWVLTPVLNRPLVVTQLGQVLADWTARQPFADESAP